HNLSVGRHCVLAVVSNLVPVQLCRLVNDWKQGNTAESRRIHYELLPLKRAMGLETIPIPVKTALALMGLVSEEIRLPMTKLRAENRAHLSKLLDERRLLP